MTFQLFFFFEFFFPENRIWYFIQIVSYGDNLHEMSNLFIWEKKKNIIILLSAEIVVVKW